MKRKRLKAKIKKRIKAEVDGVLRKSTERASDWRSLAGPIRDALAKNTT